MPLACVRALTADRSIINPTYLEAALQRVRVDGRYGIDFIANGRLDVTVPV